jgi:DNA-binding MarR family transcriptional regulator
LPRQHYKASTYGTQSNIGYLMKRGQSLLVDLIEPVLEPHRLIFVQYAILMMLRDGLAVNPTEISRLYRHDSGALTRVIDQLAERRLVERLPHKRDGRKVDLRLTAAGRKMIQTLLPSVVAALNGALADFSATDLRDLSRLLTKFNTHLQASVEAEGGAGVGS